VLQVSPPKIFLKLGNFNFTTYKSDIDWIRMSPPEMKVIRPWWNLGIWYVASRVVKRILWLCCNNVHIPLPNKIKTKVRTAPGDPGHCSGGQSFPTFLRCSCKSWWRSKFCTYIYYPMLQVSPPKILLKSGNFNSTTYKSDIYGIHRVQTTGLSSCVLYSRLCWLPSSCESSIGIPIEFAIVLQRARTELGASLYSVMGSICRLQELKLSDRDETLGYDTWHQEK
jgi:hypothetical protein